MSIYLGTGVQEGTPSIQTNNTNVFVISSQVVAGATSTNVTYNMSVEEMTPSDDSLVHFDYVFDYTLANAAAAASFCNAFTVTGASAYSSSSNTTNASASLNNPDAVKAILLTAFADATAEAGQTPQTGAPTKANLTASDTIDSTLTSVLKQFVSAYTQAQFDDRYFSVAIGTQTALQTVDVHIELDDDTGDAALKREAAAAAAVAAGGAINADATKLHLQLPASNLRLYENASTSVLSNALALKGGDTVVLGFSVTLDPPTATCPNSSGNVTNGPPPAAAASHPSQLEASPIEVDVALDSSAIRAVEIAIRLIMPGSGAIDGVRMGGDAAPALVV